MTSTGSMAPRPAIRRRWTSEGAASSEEMATVGFELLGPGTRQGERPPPRRANLTPDTRNVPTYRTVKEGPVTASRQLDYVFASRGFHERVRAGALNEVHEWGSIDHCRLVIEVE